MANLDNWKSREAAIFEYQRRYQDKLVLATMEEFMSKKKKAKKKVLKKKAGAPKGSVKGISVTLILSEKQVKKLKRLSNSSYVSRSAIAREAIDSL